MSRLEKEFLLHPRFSLFTRKAQWTAKSHSASLHIFTSQTGTRKMPQGLPGASPKMGLVFSLFFINPASFV
jgi:hypothetical protein